jgi:hypothetical protein
MPLVLSLFFVPWLAGNAEAHGMEAEYRVTPGGKVQVECWFDQGGESPRRARVEVFRSDSTVLAAGQLDEQGLFVFSCATAEPLRVVITAAGGHRKELAIPATALAQVLDQKPQEAAPATRRETTEVLPQADRSSRVSAKDVLLGITFLLAAAAFVLSLRNARELRQQRLKEKTSLAEPGPPA